NFSPSIDEDGVAWMGLADFATNHAALRGPIVVNIYNQWGGVIRTMNWAGNNSSTRQLNVCPYLGKRLQFSITTPDGTCNLGWMDLNGTPGVVLTSALGQGKLVGDHISEGKINVYCGQ